MKILIIRMKNSEEDIDDNGEAISQDTVQNYKTNFTPEYSIFIQSIFQNEKLEKMEDR